MDLPLKCQCGEVTGKIVDASPKHDQHVVCMCIDCQIYAHFLGQPEQLLDSHGGSDIYQITPNRLKIHQGLANIKMVKLSPKGTNRFYAACCNTPVANTAGPKVAFAGISSEFIDIPPTDRAQYLGPVISRCMAKYAIGQPPENSHPKFPASLLVKVMSKMIKGKIFGHHKPNPLYDLSQNTPVGESTVIDKALKQSITDHINQQRSAS